MGKIRSFSDVGLFNEIKKNSKLRKEFLTELGKAVSREKGLSLSKFGGAEGLGKIVFSHVMRERMKQSKLSSDVSLLVAREKQKLGAILDHVMTVTGEKNIFNFIKRYHEDKNFRVLVESEVDKIKQKYGEGLKMLDNKTIITTALKLRSRDLGIMGGMRHGFKMMAKHSIIEYVKLVGTTFIEFFDRMIHMMAMTVLENTPGAKSMSWIFLQHFGSGAGLYGKLAGKFRNISQLNTTDLGAQTVMYNQAMQNAGKQGMPKPV